MPERLSESDFVEAIAPLVDVNHDLMEIKSVVSFVLDVDVSKGNIYFVKCPRSCNSVVH